MARPGGYRRLCLVVDMEGYSRLGNELQLSAQERIESVVRSACTRAWISIRATLRQDKGDGMLLVLPIGVDEPAVIPELVLGLRHALHQANSGAEPVVRMRAALTQGVVHEGRTGYVGDAVVAACRIVDSAALRAELAGHTGGDLVVAFTEDLYRDPMRAGYAGIDAGGFHLIDVRMDKFTGQAWVHRVPRGPVPPPPDRPRTVLATRIVAAAATGAAVAAVTVVLGEELADLLEHTTEQARIESQARPAGTRAPDLDDLLPPDEEADDMPEIRLYGHVDDDDPQ